MNCFGLIGGLNYPGRTIELLSEQGDTAYSSSTSHVYFNIARQRSARAPKHENSSTERASEAKILHFVGASKNTYFS